MNEPTQPAYQIEADNQENPNIKKKLAEIGLNWPKLAKKGQNSTL